MGLMLARLLYENKELLAEPSSLNTTSQAIDSSLSVRPLIFSHQKSFEYRSGNKSTNNNQKLSEKAKDLLTLYNEAIENKENMDDTLLSFSSRSPVSLESCCNPFSPSDFSSQFGEDSQSSYATCLVGFINHGLSLPSSAQWNFLDPTWCHLVDHEGNQLLLGEGRFGEVVKAICYGRESVVKKFKANQPVSKVLWEADMTAYLGSFGVCPVLLGVMSASERTYHLPALVMEYVPRADDMHHLMEERGWTFYRLEMLDALAQAANLLEFLHKRRILHNDIKHANYIMAPNPCYLGRPVQGVSPPPRRGTSNWPRRFRVYMIDLANASYKGGTQLRMDGGTRRRYSNIAPEVIVAHTNTSFASDVYSFGILLRYMAKFRLTHYLREVVRRCSQTIPDYRPSMRQVVLYLEHITEAQASNHDDDGHIPQQTIDDVIRKVWSELYVPNSSQDLSSLC